MRNLRLLLLLCSLVLALGVVLVRPLPSRADAGDPAGPPPPPPPNKNAPHVPPPTGDPAAPPPDPAPTNTDPIVPPLPVVEAPVVRRPASVVRRALRVPLGAKVVKYAERFLGVRYVYGGSSPSSGFDCSGFVRYVYSHFGVRLAHSSYAQFGSGFGVRRGGLKPGDLVFFHGLGHVGIYVGNGKFIHAPHSGSRVRIESLGGWYSSRLDGARRLAAAH
jgi:cell wall-associated NlpC family hydrolase